MCNLRRAWQSASELSFVRRLKCEPRAVWRITRPERADRPMQALRVCEHAITEMSFDSTRDPIMTAEQKLNVKRGIQ